MNEVRDRTSEPGLSVEELAAVREAARALARQDGRGVPRRPLLALAGSGSRLSVLRPPAEGDPVVAIVGGARSDGDDVFAALTPREREIAALVGRGDGNKRIAAILGISVATVKDHVHHILAKTGLGTRAAVAAAWQRR